MVSLDMWDLQVVYLRACGSEAGLPRDRVRASSQIKIAEISAIEIVDSVDLPSVSIEGGCQTVSELEPARVRDRSASCHGSISDGKQRQYCNTLL